ncbi:MAG: helix-turn-helix domain-containing protein [Planctomycetota bacterium]
MAHGDTVRPSDLGLQPDTNIETQPEDMTLEEIERQAICRTLNRCNGDISKAATTLGLSRGALYRRLEKYQIGF